MDGGTKGQRKEGRIRDRERDTADKEQGESSERGVREKGRKGVRLTTGCRKCDTHGWDPVMQ